MASDRAFKSFPIDDPSQSVSSFITRLPDEQHESLRACAKGISLRFEKSEVVNALRAAGYANKNVAGVIAFTVTGHQYMRRHCG